MTAIEFNHQLLTLEPLLSGMALKLTTNSNDASDLLQDTMLKALTARDQFVHGSNIGAWTYTIMKNIFINNYRRSIRQNITFDYTTDLFYLSQRKDTKSDTPDSEYCIKEIFNLINCLEDEYKIPLKMFLDGYKYKEIADKLNIKLGTVKSRIFFARKKIIDFI